MLRRMDNLKCNDLHTLLAGTNNSNGGCYVLSVTARTQYNTLSESKYVQSEFGYV